MTNGFSKIKYRINPNEISVMAFANVENGARNFKFFIYKKSNKKKYFMNA